MRDRNMGRVGMRWSQTGKFLGRRGNFISIDVGKVHTHSHTHTCAHARTSGSRSWLKIDFCCGFSDFPGYHFQTVFRRNIERHHS